MWKGVPLVGSLLSKRDGGKVSYLVISVALMILVRLSLFVFVMVNIGK